MSVASELRDAVKKAKKLEEENERKQQTKEKQLVKEYFDKFIANCSKSMFAEADRGKSEFIAPIHDDYNKIDYSLRYQHLLDLVSVWSTHSEVVFSVVELYYQRKPVKFFPDDFELEKLNFCCHSGQKCFGDHAPFIGGGPVYAFRFMW